MIASSTARLAFYPVTTRAAQNEHNGDREISSPGAAPGAAIMNPENPSDLGVVFSVSGRTIKGTPGIMIFLLSDVRHPFTIESEQYRMLMLVVPAGFEAWFKEFSVPTPAMTLPPENEPAYGEVKECWRPLLDMV